MTTSDLIRRARELARLAEKATPGPWIEDGDGVSTSFSSPAGDVAVACTVCNDTDRAIRLFYLLLTGCLTGLLRASIELFWLDEG